MGGADIRACWKHHAGRHGETFRPHVTTISRSFQGLHKEQQYKEMKLSLPLKLGIGIVLLFALVIAICLLWTPVKVNYYGWHMRSYASPTFFLAVEGLRSSGEKGKAEIDKVSEDFDKWESSGIEFAQASIVPSFVIIILFGTLVNCIIMRLWLVKFLELPLRGLYVSVLSLSLFFFIGISTSEIFLNPNSYYIGLGGKFLIIIIIGGSLGLLGFVSILWLFSLKHRPTIFYKLFLAGVILDYALLLIVTIGFLVIGNDFK